MLKKLSFYLLAGVLLYFLKEYIERRLINKIIPIKEEPTEIHAPQNQQKYE